jgi:hypothetical protein
VRRAGLPGRDLAQQAVRVPPRIVEHVEAHPFEVGNASACKRSAAMTPRGSKTAHADFLVIPSSSPARPGPTPPEQSTLFTERERARGRGGDDAPAKRLIGDAVIGAFGVSVDPLTALPSPKPSVPSRG